MCCVCGGRRGGRSKGRGAQRQSNRNEKDQSDSNRPQATTHTRTVTNCPPLLLLAPQADAKMPTTRKGGREGGREGDGARERREDDQ